jgi:hypothetical protein
MSRSFDIGLTCLARMPWTSGHGRVYVILIIYASALEYANLSYPEALPVKLLEWAVSHGKLSWNTVFGSFPSLIHMS